MPGVMGIEAMAEAALWMLPGWRVEAVEDMNFLAPLKFYRSEPLTVAVQSVFYPQGDTLIVESRLIGRRTLPNQVEPQVTTHFTGRVRLTKQPFEDVISQAPGAPTASLVDASHIYRVYFHGPAYQVLENAWWDENRMTGQMAEGLPANHHPPDLPTVIAPRLIELCFQTVGLWDIAMQGKTCLPLHFDRVSFCVPVLAEGRLYAVVIPHPDRGTFDSEVVDKAGRVYLRLNGYRTIAHLDAVNSGPLSALLAVMA